MSIVRIRLGKKDRLLKRWYKAMREMGENASETTMLLVRYYVKTGQYLDAACLKPDKEEDMADDIKSAFIPDNSDIEKWLKKKSEEGIKKSTIIKRILRSSIREGELSYVLSADEIFDKVEHPEIKQMERLDKIAEKQNDKEIYQLKEINKATEDAILEKSENHPTEKGQSNKPPEHNLTAEYASKPQEKKAKPRSNTLFDNLVTTGLRH